MGLYFRVKDLAFRCECREHHVSVGFEVWGLFGVPYRCVGLRLEGFRLSVWGFGCVGLDLRVCEVLITGSCV